LPLGLPFPAKCSYLALIGYPDDGFKETGMDRDQRHLKEKFVKPKLKPKRRKRVRPSSSARSSSDPGASTKRH